MAINDSHVTIGDLVSAMALYALGEARDDGDGGERGVVVVRRKGPLGLAASLDATEQIC